MYIYIHGIRDLCCNLFAGNFGQSLTTDTRNIDLYISRDGGLRWDQVSCMCSYKELHGCTYITYVHIYTYMFTHNTYIDTYMHRH